MYHVHGVPADPLTPKLQAAVSHHHMCAGNCHEHSKSPNPGSSPSNWYFMNAGVLDAIWILS